MIRRLDIAPIRSGTPITSLQRHMKCFSVYNRVSFLNVDSISDYTHDLFSSGQNISLLVFFVSIPGLSRLLSSQLGYRYRNLFSVWSITGKVTNPLLIHDLIDVGMQPQ